MSGVQKLHPIKYAGQEKTQCQQAITFCIFKRFTFILRCVADGYLLSITEDKTLWVERTRNSNSADFINNVADYHRN